MFSFLGQLITKSPILLVIFVCGESIGWVKDIFKKGGGDVIQKLKLCAPQRRVNMYSIVCQSHYVCLIKSSYCEPNTISDLFISMLLASCLHIMPALHACTAARLICLHFFPIPNVWEKIMIIVIVILFNGWDGCG